MLSQAYELRNVFKYATMDESIARDFEGRYMSSADWEVVDKMIKWLQGPAVISTLLCGSKYPTLTVTQLAWTKLLEHCTKSQVPDSQNTADIVQESQASGGRACLRYLMKYEDEMKSVPARIAQFLDPRMACDYLAIPSSSVCAEEANSAAKITFDSRFSLHKTTFKTESCVRSWLQTLQSMKIPLPQDYHVAFDALNLDFQTLAEDDEVIEYMLDDTHGREKDAAQEV
ncbi:hypothetical protein R1sor_005636 [Riccia sorocarpa]|uniref:HAT C-terminal dimerisation domain-containing protein n=1 Tax=Riccia sorocarpa TaxID=122646 RepID=A0ABD3HPI7_9MARC